MCFQALGQLVCTVLPSRCPLQNGPLGKAASIHARRITMKLRHVGCHKVSKVLTGLRLHLGFRAPIGATALWHVHQGWAWPDRPPPGQPRSRCSWAVKRKTWCAAGLYNISLGFRVLRLGFRVGFRIWNHLAAEHTSEALNLYMNDPRHVCPVIACHVSWRRTEPARLQ